MTHQQPAIRINVTPKGSAIPGVQSLEKSSCNCLPETGWPCELNHVASKNPICHRCSVRMGGRSTNATRDQRIEMSKYMDGRESYYESKTPRNPKTECAAAWCKNMSRGKYCKRCLVIVGGRKTMFGKGSTKWAPWTWDTVPPGQQPPLKQPKRKCK